MIVNKLNKSFQSRSDKPNINWLGEDWYLVPDNSNLALKIERLYPRFDFVVSDNGELIDVVEIQKTEQELIQEEIESIDLELSDIDAQGVTRHMENIIDATNSYDTLYESTKQLIERKKELRIKRAELITKLNNL